MPNPTGGTNSKRANTIAAVVFNPSRLLPTPGPKIKKKREFNYTWWNCLGKKSGIWRKKKRRYEITYHQRDCHPMLTKCKDSSPP